ncbi:MarR family winged helix-turn-helix transcriptional regulator [Deinococcus sp.]|uniref:MarR family winged helix-turn-helix transcriptional regulator n=1 Tax=Deinococcus sp. TaxID=47478 RepID=UPI003B5A0B39
MLHSLSSMLSARTRVALSDLVAYEHIRLYGPLSAKEVSRRVQMGSGATTALIDRLERRGYVRRTPHATDRRSVMVETLTRQTLSIPKLDAFLERLNARISALEPSEQQLISAFFKDITEDGLETLK